MCNVVGRVRQEGLPRVLRYRRMRRFLSFMFTLALLVVCLAAGVLWVRSNWVTSLATWQPEAKDGDGWSEYRLNSHAGRLGLWRAGGERRGFPAVPAGWQWSEYEPPPSRVLTWGVRHEKGAEDRKIQAFGFHVYYTDPAGGGFASQQGMYVPYWAIIAVTGVWALRRIRKVLARRAVDGAVPCAKCGYDLRGSPGRCPECGTLPETLIPNAW
jgi:hypothetical protein